MAFPKKTILKSFVWLSLLGLALSLYLSYTHFAPPTEGSFCDFTENISCSLVNTSIYSELFHVPVALFGALWFFVLLMLTWNAFSAKYAPVFVRALFAWSLPGFLFILYMIYAEIQLEAICPLCTLLHLFILYILVASYLLMKHEKKPSKKELVKYLRPWVIFIAILFLVPTIIFNLPKEQQDYSAFAQCLAEKNVVMYGSFRCGICAKTREMFGESFKYIQEVECHPEGKNAQTERCAKVGVKRTPTWTLEKDGEVLAKTDGFTSPEKLAQMSACSLDLITTVTK